MEIGIAWWGWMVIGIILCISEILTPGFFLFFVGSAAIITGAINWIMPELGFVITGFIFITLSIILCVVGKPLYKKDVSQTNATLNKKGEQYIGQTFTLVEDIENNKGKVKVGDTVWPVITDKDFKSGDNVTVKGIDGIYFVVE